jgi:hypothetical protein
MTQGDDGDRSFNRRAGLIQRPSARGCISRATLGRVPRLRQASATTNRLHGRARQPTRSVRAHALQPRTRGYSSLLGLMHHRSRARCIMPQQMISRKAIRTPNRICDIGVVVICVFLATGGSPFCCAIRSRTCDPARSCQPDPLIRDSRTADSLRRESTRNRPAPPPPEPRRRRRYAARRSQIPNRGW